MGYQPSYGFLKDCLYRSESYKVTLADAYRPRAGRLCESDESIEEWMPLSLCDRANRGQLILRLVGLASGARRREDGSP